MRLHIVCPYWGMEGTGASAFMDKVQEAGYDGIEINVPEDADFKRALGFELDLLREEGRDFVFIAQQYLPPARETAAEYLRRLETRLYEVASLRPTMINSHTGKDFFSFEENCRIIETCIHISAETGIPVVHETHRGRFSFHAATLLPYLKAFPTLALTADLSHWCVVSVSLLEDQADILAAVWPRVAHIHARVGFEQAPQVNDPRSPEWEGHLARFLGWWRTILDQRGDAVTTITPEFGPVPYMPTLPFTRRPVADQWEINLAMKAMIEKHLA